MSKAKKSPVGGASHQAIQVFACNKCEHLRQWGKGYPENRKYEPLLYCSHCDIVERHTFIESILPVAAMTLGVEKYTKIPERLPFFVGERIYHPFPERHKHLD